MTPPATAVSHDAVVVADWLSASATLEGVPHPPADQPHPLLLLEIPFWENLSKNIIEWIAN